MFISHKQGMSHQRVGSLRKTSHTSSTTSLRRSSISSRDITAIQQALLRQRPISHHTVGVLLVVLPFIAFFLLHGIHEHGANLWETTWSVCFRWPFWLRAVPPITDFIAWKILAVLVCVQLLLHEVLPRDAVAIVNGGGEPTTYRDTNGFACTIVVCLAYALGAALKIYRADLIYLHFPAIVSVLAVVAIASTFALYGYYRVADTHTVDNVYDFFFGVELEPRILEIDIKHFIRSRITMGLYALYTVSAAYYNYSTFKGNHQSVAICASAHFFVILAWQWCEDVQLNGVDAKWSNFGFARLWADLVLYPVLYTSPVAIVASRKKQVSPVVAAILFAFVAICTIFTYIAARERLHFRRHKGNVKIGGHDPYFIMAKFRGDSGDAAANLLLGSGYWGWCRHPSYLFEGAVHAGLSLFAGWIGVMGHASALFIAAYLLIRISFDETRCLAKYGPCWAQHCQRVRFRIIPGVY